MCVSILVLMEVLREATVGFENGIPKPVSILVLMEVLREALWPICNEVFRRVSILVLMEVLREEGELTSRMIELRSFNPCFNGSVERGEMEMRLPADLKKFQSLF